MSEEKEKWWLVCEANPPYSGRIAYHIVHWCKSWIVAQVLAWHHKKAPWQEVWVEKRYFDKLEDFDGDKV